MVFCLCGVCLTITLAGVLLLAKPVIRQQIIALGFKAAAIVVRRIRRGPPAIATLASILLAGCMPVGQPRVYPLPAQPPERPACNLPTELHVRNWLGPLNQGSCVHASLKNHALWHNDFEFVETWPYSDGEYASRLRQRLDKAGIEYAYTEKSDPRFLDWCDQQRHGAILWWKPSHCCTFMGWVTNSQGQQHAAILDNNYPGKFEYVERQQFIRLWSGYGGFALCLLEPPTIAMPYKSYEVE